MRCSAAWFGVVLVMVWAMGTAGCNRAPAPTKSDAPQGATPVKHDHGAPGVHGGPRPVLGNHEYHAELTHNEASGEVAVYITDAQYKSVPVPEKELFLTVAIAGKPREFKLANDVKQNGAPPRETRFVLVDKQLCAAVGKAGEAGVRMNAVVHGKPYTTTFASQTHDDDDHDHDAHGEKPGHDHAKQHQD
jgi:hypothetical protein